MFDEWSKLPNVVLAAAADAMEQIAIRFPRPMLGMVDEIIAGRLDRPDRSSIIRELVAEALRNRGQMKH